MHLQQHLSGCAQILAIPARRRVASHHLPRRRAHAALPGMWSTSSPGRSTAVCDGMGRTLASDAATYSDFLSDFPSIQKGSLCRDAVQSIRCNPCKQLTCPYIYSVCIMQMPPLMAPRRGFAPDVIANCCVTRACCLPSKSLHKHSCSCCCTCQTLIVLGSCWHI